ncbi:hypothetical protein ABXT08_12255 [Chryseobacterium sp. NRRL B-14859]|uniref:MutS-related protein n=1 Tax=Chryseobacterium sp. NRRL B-14859 TaxID=1562763 RepID=UPI00339236C9
MSFLSILFPHTQELYDESRSGTLPFMADLNLDSVIDEIILGREEYNLRPIFNRWPLEKEVILYRQQIMSEIENETINTGLLGFSNEMKAMRTMLKNAVTCRYEYHRERLFLDSVYAYCQAVLNLEEKLSSIQLSSDGLKNFSSFISAYVSSEPFQSQLKVAEELIQEMGKVRYDLEIDGLLVKVLPYRPQTDYDTEIRSFYSKFIEGQNKDYRESFPVSMQMNDVEALILKGIATLYPELFNRLSVFYQQYQNFRDDRISGFDREIQFYLAYGDYCRKISNCGSPFCIPEIVNGQEDISVSETFDIALAAQLAKEDKKPVLNDLTFSGNERIIIVSGPNQGGKTTFARSFGQLHYLAALGVAVPGSSACLLLCDMVYTHFEKAEDIQLQQSKLESDLNRMHTIITNATQKSVVILNEIFSSTTLLDSKFLSEKLIEHLQNIGSYCIWVTFIDELSALSCSAFNMSTGIDSEDSGAKRTYKITRQCPDGKAYALSLAEKYQLTFNQLINRIAP